MAIKIGRYVKETNRFLRQLATKPGVRVEGSEVILTGTVESREDKRRAEDMAESVSGVSNVQNQLRVSHSEGGSTIRAWNNNESRGSQG